ILQKKIEWKSTTSALAKTEDQFETYQFPPSPDHPGIRMVWNENGSQPGSWGNGWKWLNALRNPRIECVVGVHPWLENDLGFSDLILPAQTTYEHNDLVIVQRSDILGMFYQDQAIEPVGDSLSDFEIHRQIGLKLGLEEAFPPAEEWLQKAYEETIAQTKHGIGWDEFKERKYFIYDSPTWDEWVEIKKDRGFSERGGGMSKFWETGIGLETPSGKIEFVSSMIQKKDPNNKERPPVARWLSHSESPDQPKSRVFPLIVMSNHARYRFHVQGDDIPWIQELQKVKGADGYMYEACWIHPVDAATRDVKNGDILKVYNERGTVLVGAFVTERIVPGAVSIDHGAKMDIISLRNEEVDRGGCINLISPTPQEKYGDGEIKIPEMNVTGFLVEVEKIDPTEINDGTLGSLAAQ
ncbi:MAG: molybdopterin dinucleotide binding domain-containing protein, partial [Pseudomonadota bacterium]|nr:molybdopterin dinucleotide binding domain-containing protein [Pseudomonadota bacterium]